MPRTTALAVAAIVKTSDAITGGGALSGLDPFIEVANYTITKFCGSSTAYGATDLEMFERLLAAHYYTVRDKTVGRTAQSAGDVSDTFGLKLGMRLDASNWGQQLKVLCPELAAADKRADAATPMPGVLWLGSHDTGYGRGEACP